jgi:hypothetical protein
MTTSTVPRSQGRPAYVTLPGLSPGSLLAALPSIMVKDEDEKRRPILLMDIRDFNRLQGIALANEDEPWTRNKAMAISHLRRRGAIRLIDYTHFYLESIQEETLYQNQSVLEGANAEEQQNAAVEGIGNLIKYARGEFQEPIRTFLGEDPDWHKAGRATEEKRRRKLKRGLGDPHKINERILDRHMAALIVRRYADGVLPFNVKRVIGEGESSILTNDGLAADAGHIKRLDPNENIKELDTEALGDTREAFDLIETVAVEQADVEDNDWSIISPRHAIPQFDDLFGMGVMQQEFEDGLDPETLMDEAAYVVDTVKRRTGEVPKSNHANELLKQSDIMPFAHQPAYQEVSEMEDYATTLSEFSREIRPLVDSGQVSHAAGLVGANVISDVPTKDDREAIYLEGKDLIDRLNPAGVSKAQRLAVRRRKSEWENNPDWFETMYWK